MIVKIQQSQSSNDGQKHVLVYNESKTLMHQQVAPREVLRLLLGRPKAYFEAEINPDSGMLELGDEVPAEAW